MLEEISSAYYHMILNLPSQIRNEKFMTRRGFLERFYLFSLLESPETNNSDFQIQKFKLCEEIMLHATPVKGIDWYFQKLYRLCQNWSANHKHHLKELKSVFRICVRIFFYEHIHGNFFHSFIISCKHNVLYIWNFWVLYFDNC